MTSTEAIQNLAFLLDLSKNPFFPSGGIIMWSGTLATIPAGWVLCDGTHGTPNLSGRFILGYNAADVGGAKPDPSSGSGGVIPFTSLHANKMLDASGEEMHTLSLNEMPSHAHTYTAAGWAGHATLAAAAAGDWGNKNGQPTDTSYIGGNANVPKNPLIDLSGNQVKDSTGNLVMVAGTSPHNNMPPYFVLAFIMKT